MGALYQIEFPNGKSYIGITMQTAEARFRGHLRESQKGKRWALHSAIAKYGAEHVRVKTLALANDWAYLQLIERNAIRVFDTFGPNGYNMTAGGEGFRGAHTDAAKAKIAEAGRNCSAETREKIGRAFRGKPGSNLGSKHCDSAKAAKSLRQLTAPLNSKNTSGHTGVYWNKAAKKWQAFLKTAGKIKYLGIYTDKAEACRVREAALTAYLAGVSA